ncbi:MAG: 2OG-Fe(II) oxygenase [Acidobacteriota bacterium]|nr:2OG-Fe(II) oxygenase [Acidobacteriota bacterium]
MLLVENQIIDFADIEFQNEPFDYFLLPKAFDDNQSLSVLKWLETDAPWNLVEADFYTQYEFSIDDVKLPEQIAFLYERYFLDYLVEQFEDLFSIKLKTKVDLTAHKLVNGHTIRLHNDFVPGQETHRLLIQLNRNWQDENGGFLLFFYSSAPEDVHRVVRPVHNSSVGFAITPKSNHAVSTVYNGERYTLVYSFYAADSAD